MAATADSVVDANGDRYWIELGIDTGTGRHNLHCVVMKNDKPLHQMDPMLLKLQGQTDTSAAIGWHNKRFYWGDTLLNKVARGEFPAHKVMLCTKLALYEPFAVRGTSAIVDTVVDQHANEGVTIDDSFVALYTHIIAAARECLCKTELLQAFQKQGRAFLMNIPIRARIGIPHCFSISAGARLSQAAISGGAASVNLGSEQMATLQAYLDTYLGAVSTLVEPFVVVDAGCGTVDSVKYVRSGGEGVTRRFRALAQSTGSVSGSQKVNQYIQEMIENQVPEGIESEYTRLGKEPNEFTFELLAQIERCKKEFFPYHLDETSTASEETLLGAVSIINPRTKEEFRCRITAYMVQIASDRVFSELIPSVDTLLQLENESKDPENPTYVVLCGGYGLSAYFYYQIEAHYRGRNIAFIQKSGDTTLVSRGAMSPSYGLIEAQTIPLGNTYAMVDDAFYDPDLHADCWTHNRVLSRIANPRKVALQIQGAALDQRTVLSRFRIFLHKGQRPDQMRPIIQIYQPFVDDPVVTVSVVCTELDIEEHGPALDDDHEVGRHDNKLRKGILPWAKPSWTLDKDVMQRHGWDTVADSETGRPRYKGVWIKTSLRCTEEKNMVVELELILPDETSKESNKNGKTIKVEGLFKLWDSRRPDFLSDADAGR